VIRQCPRSRSVREGEEVEASERGEGQGVNLGYELGKFTYFEASLECIDITTFVSFAAGYFPSLESEVRVL
jgi:hypothetical protein